MCFPRGYAGPGHAGDAAWAGAAGFVSGHRIDTATITGAAAGSYVPGLLALRSGHVLEDAVRALSTRPNVVLVDATGYDHPRRAGLTRHLGALLDVPTIGVTHRPLLAAGAWPASEAGAVSPLSLNGELVGYWTRTRTGRRPLAVHAGWRTDACTAVRVVTDVCRYRTPEPLREARRLARTARDDAGG